MALSMIVALVSAPALLGTQEAIRQGQSKEKREEHRARRCNLIATCVKSSSRSREIDGRQVVLRNGKLYIDTSMAVDDDEPFGHPFAGYYLPYPDTNYEGLVTTITDEAPILNWVFIDKDTYAARYGVRADAQANLTGPWNCTRQDRRMTFEGWEGFVAVEEENHLWAVHFDREDNGLREKVASGTRILEIELTRREKRWKKEVSARHADQTTIHTSEETPSTTKEDEINQQATSKETERNEHGDTPSSTEPGGVPLIKTELLNDRDDASVSTASFEEVDGDATTKWPEQLTPKSLIFGDEDIPTIATLNDESMDSRTLVENAVDNGESNNLDPQMKYNMI